MLAGCGGQETHLDASSQDALEESLEILASQQRADGDRARLEKAIATYWAIRQSSGDDPTLPPLDAVDGMGSAAFLHHVERLSHDALQFGAVQDDDPLFPNPAYTSTLLEQLEMENGLLEGRMHAVLDAGMNTANQYPIIDVAFIPPSDGMALELDMAKFLVTLRNDSGFDAYQPVFKIKINRPQDDWDILNREFDFKSTKEPLFAGDSRIYEMRCCSIALDPHNNAALKALPDGAQLEVSVLSISDHANRAIMRNDKFSMTDYLRLGTLKQCLEQMRGNEATWVPGEDNGTNEGCAGGAIHLSEPADEGAAS